MKQHDSQILIHCTDEMKAKALKLAEAKGQSLNEWVRRAIQDAIDRESSALEDNGINLEALKQALLELKKEGFLENPK